ncbi:MAG: hypothetical protein OXQ84_21830 [bacterium]|nr:hypothetical protein [bacterium]
MDGFSREVFKELKHYVYRLVDPRNGNTFYVGRGQKNRVFAHVHASLKPSRVDEDDTSLKLDYIRELNGKGIAPIHVIHRHGLTSDVAVEVEAALIDCYPGLMNELAGAGSFARGSATAKEIEEQYAATIMEPAKEHKLLYIKTGASTVRERGLYEAVRGNWIVNERRVTEADYIIAVVDQICRGVFLADIWQPTPHRRGRYYFRGREAPPEVIDRYRDKRIPQKYRKKGMAGPVVYGWPQP